MGKNGLFVDGGPWELKGSVVRIEYLLWSFERNKRRDEGENFVGDL